MPLRPFGGGVAALGSPIDAEYTEIPTPDGGVIIRWGPGSFDNEENDELAGSYDEEFYENLAEKMSDSDLARIAEELLEGIEDDIASMQVWLSNYTTGVGILGLQLKKPKSEATSEGVSVVDHPLLLEATIMYQSNACAELLPAEGPVKIDNSGQSTAITDEDANRLEKDMNEFITVHSPEYVPDTEQMLFQQGFGGAGIKKLFHCPIRRRPVSDSIEPGDFIINNTAKSIDNCARKTHRIKMRPGMMKRMMFMGAYRDINLMTPTENVNLIERKTAELQGRRPNAVKPEDTDFTIYECCAELDMPGDEHRERGRMTGLPRPYLVSIERDTRAVLEIRRNWVQDDELFAERRRFVLYPFLPTFGLMPSGLLNVLGNTTSAMTAGWRIMIDAGMFANFPGGMYLKNGERQKDNNFRPAPGQFVSIDGSGTDDINKVIKPLPYKEPGPATQQFFKDVGETGQRVGGTANIPVAEGKADAPVGTTLAALEQVSKLISAVHRRCHAAQAREFQIWLELIREKPEDFIKFFERKGHWTIDKLLRAINNWALIPRADPNTPTQMHRIIKAMGLKQLEQLSPDRFDGKKVDEHIMRTALSIEDPEEFFAPPQPPGAAPPDPTLAVATIVAQTKQAEIASRQQIEMGKGKLKMIELQQKQAADAAKIQSAESIAAHREEAATAREVFKAGATMEQAQAEAMEAGSMSDQQLAHEALQADLDRQHQAGESEAARQSSEKIAASRPKPTTGGTKK